MNRSLIRTLDFIVMALLLASPAVSQNVQNNEQSDKAFTLKLNTDIVLVNVTVKDKNGAFIRNLKQDDFTITEDGKTQKILSLDQEETDAVAVTNEVQAANLLGELNGLNATQIQTQAGARQTTAVDYSRDTFRDRRLVVLFFDLTSMQPEEISRSIESANQYINEPMK